MVLEILPYSLTVCKVSHVRDINLEAGFFFVGRTDSEISLVCKTEDVPPGATERVDGWKGFRVRGTPGIERDRAFCGIYLRHRLHPCS